MLSIPASGVACRFVRGCISCSFDGEIRVGAGGTVAFGPRRVSALAPCLVHFLLSPLTDVTLYRLTMQAKCEGQSLVCAGRGAGQWH